MNAAPEILIAFAVYLLAMLAIGAYAYGRTTGLADYILGGRRLGAAITALSAGASDMSGWLLLGLPGFAYLAGFEAGWIVLGLAVGTYLNWRLVAPRLRRATAQARDSLTLPEFFERRFGDDTRSLRLVSAVLILFFFTFYTSSGLVAGGKLFNVVFGLPYPIAVAIGAAVIVAYTFLGGFFAVCWTDVVQALLMAAALVAVPLIAIGETGGAQAMLSAMQASNPELLNPFTAKDGTALGAIAILSLLGWGLGYFGQPHILARFMAIEHESALPRARRIAMSWVTITLIGAFAAGIAGIGLIDPPLAGADSEKVFMRLVELLVHPLIAGIFLAAILAAIMSTADSQLLVVSAAITQDIYRPLFGKKTADASLVWIGRGAVLATASIAYLLALDPKSKVLELVAYAWAGFGATFGPVVLFALYWQRTTRRAALAGMLVGAAAVIVWKELAGGVFDLYEIIPGFCLSALTIYMVSLIDAPGRTARIS